MITEVPSPSFVWTDAPPGAYFWRVVSLRGTESSQASAEGQLLAIDLRDIIDAMLYGSGPWSDTKTKNNVQLRAWVGPVQLKIHVSRDCGPGVPPVAQAFADKYAEASNGAVTAVVDVVDESFADINNVTNLPPDVIAARVLLGFCPSGAGACASGGPPILPGTLGRATVTFTAANQTSLVQHELGHAYGFYHILLPNGVGLPAPMMSSSAGPTMSDYETLALRLIWESPLRGGSRRADAVALGLVNP